MNKKYCILQDDLKDCGVCCLLSIIKFYNGDVSREYLKELTKTTNQGVSALNLLKAARELGFEAYGLHGKIKNIKRSFLPLIAHVVIEKKYGHFIVIYDIDFKNSKLLVMDPSKGFTYLSFSSFNSISTDYYLILKIKQLIPNLKVNKNNKIPIISLFKKYQKLFIIVLVISIIYTIINIISSYQFQLFVEEINLLNSSDLDKIFIVLFILVFFQNIFDYIRNTLINLFNLVLDKKIIINTFNHIIHLPYLYYKNHSSGDLLTRINDLGNIKELVSNFFISIFIDLIFTVFFLIVLFNINVKLTIIMLSFLIIYIVYSIVNNYLVKDYIKDIHVEISGVNNYLIESLCSFDTIKNLSLHDYIFRLFKKKYVKYVELNQQLLKKINFYNFIRNLLLSICNLVVIYNGSINIQNNIISLTSLVTFIMLMNYLVNPIKNLLDMQIMFLNTKDSIRRINDIYELPEEEIIYNENTNIKYLNGNINVDNLCYSYNGLNNTINNLSLEIKEGERVLLYGNSGTGKSTLIKLFTKYLDNNYQGNIFIGGYDLKQIDLFSLRKNICYISQNEYLYSNSVYENITLGKKIAYKKFLEVAKELFVDEIVKNSNLKYNYVIESNGSNISGGERQRIIIARALFQNANIYIFDESFSELDVIKERRILKYIFNKYPKKTFIVVSHRFSNEDLFNQKLLIGEKYE